MTMWRSPREKNLKLKRKKKKEFYLNNFSHFAKKASIPFNPSNFQQNTRVRRAVNVLKTL